MGKIKEMLRRLAILLGKRMLRWGWPEGKKCFFESANELEVAKDFFQLWKKYFRKIPFSACFSRLIPGMRTARLSDLEWIWSESCVKFKISPNDQKTKYDVIWTYNDSEEHHELIIKNENEKREYYLYPYAEEKYFMQLITLQTIRGDSTYTEKYNMFNDSNILSFECACKTSKLSVVFKTSIEREDVKKTEKEIINVWNDIKNQDRANIFDDVMPKLNTISNIYSMNLKMFKGKSISGSKVLFDKYKDQVSSYTIYKSHINLIGNEIKDKDVHFLGSKHSRYVTSNITIEIKDSYIKIDVKINTEKDDKTKIVSEEQIRDLIKKMKANNEKFFPSNSSRDA